MPVSILGKNVKAILGNALSRDMPYVTLVRNTPGSRTSAVTSGNHPTQTTIKCRGYLRWRESMAKEGQRRRAWLSLMGSTMGTAEPRRGDLVTLSGEGAQFVIDDVRRGTAGAVWKCHITSIA